MSEGWVVFHRKITEWEWFKFPNAFLVFGYLILKANHSEGKWHGNIIGRGQLITGRKKIATDCSISEQCVRSILCKLESTNEITIKATNKFSLITICNYDIYQMQSTNKITNGTTTINQQLTNNQPTTNQQLTTNNNNNTDKNEDNDKNNLKEENMGAEAPPSRKGKKSFIKPTLEEVSQYCNEAQLIIPPEEFYDEMESTGWLLKRGAVKDWKATIRNWNRNRVKWAKEGKSALRGQYLNKMQRVDLAFERLDEEIKLAKEKGVEIRSENLAWLSETAPKTISAIK